MLNPKLHPTPFWEPPESIIPKVDTGYKEEEMLEVNKCGKQINSKLKNVSDQKLLDLDPKNPAAEEKWTDWFSSFENFLLKENVCTERMKLMVLSVIISNSLFMCINQCKTFTEAIEILQNLFISKNGALSLNELLTRKQEEGETVKEYFKVLSKLAEDCVYCSEEQRNCFLLHAFIGGLKSSQIRKRHKKNENSNLSSAVDQELEFELTDVLSSLRPISATNCTCNVYENSTLTRTIKQPLNLVASVPSSHLNVIYPVEVNGCRANCLFDTGSATSFINAQFVSNNNLPNCPSIQQIVIMASTSLNQTISGYSEVSVKCGGHIYHNLKLSILRNLCTDLLIGCDVMKDHSKVEFEFGGPQLPLVIGDHLLCTAPNH